MANKNNKVQGGIPVHKPANRKEFNALNHELRGRGFVAIDALKPGLVRSLTLGDKDPSLNGAQDMAVGMGYGALSNGPLAKVAYSFDSRDTAPTSVTDKDGKQLGRGYVKWGPADNLPSEIYALSKSSPYTSAPLRYLADLATGLGVRYMYRFADGTTCEFRHAGEKLLQRIEELEAKEPKNENIAMEFIAGRREESSALRRAREDYAAWERGWYGYDEKDADGEVVRHVPMAKEFLENNNLDLHFAQCMQEDQMFDLYFPAVGFERGRRGAWQPKIVRVGFLSIVHGGIRYEVMNEYRHIQHVYFGERFRARGLGEANTVSAEKMKEVVMYPVAEATNRVSEFRYIVESNQRTRIKDRPTWVVCPIYYGTQNYYQQPAWWSIFPIKAFDFSSTILYDKAKQRENRTSWGKIIFISLDYLDQVFADDGYAGDKDKQQEFIDELDRSVEEFLQHRENNGKMMRQFMWLGQDGKEHHNVEIVDVADMTKDEAAAGKDELELSTNPIFLAFGVDPRDVGVPMVHSSNGGTALREIRLMKQQLLNVRQRAYINFMENISTYNEFDEHGFWAISQQSFTTLDRNPSGMIETQAGTGA